MLNKSSEQNISTTEYYMEEPRKAVEIDTRFKHVMAITLDSNANNEKGIIRCITSRKGDVQISGYVDKSELHWINKGSNSTFEIGERLSIKNEESIVASLAVKGTQFLGLEDPDIYYDEKDEMYHLYFTMPFIRMNRDDKTIKSRIHLGHAVGSSLESLEMTMPVLVSDGILTAKEVAIAPLNKSGQRLNLFESSDKIGTTYYSVVRVGVADQFGGNWEYGDIVLNPAELNIDWMGGHASPGPFFPREFIDVGEGKLLGLVNGREANQIIDGKTKYGMFSVGLYIYDYEQGKVDWVSPVPFIQDSEAVTITFASQFIQNGVDKGRIFAHVDDSFVRSYSVTTEGINQFLSKFSGN